MRTTIAPIQNTLYTKRADKQKFINYHQIAIITVFYTDSVIGSFNLVSEIIYKRQAAHSIT